MNDFDKSFIHALLRSLMEQFCFVPFIEHYSSYQIIIF